MLQAAVADDGAVGEDGDDAGQVEALFAFQRGCELGFEPACGNYRAILDGNGAFERAPPTVADYPIVLRGSKGEITARDPRGVVCSGLSAGMGGCLRVCQVMTRSRAGAARSPCVAARRVGEETRR